MKIVELHLKHFGKFEDKRFRFRPGINIICGGNEAGKSTIYAFIRAMLFGIARGRGQSRTLDEYALRQPWDNGAYFAGSLWLEQDDKIYRIDRNFYQSDKDVKVICETDGRDITDRFLNGEWMPGHVPEEVFADTVFIPQTGAQTGAALAEQLRTLLVNRRESGDETVDVNAAIEHLRRKRRELEREKQQKNALLSEKIARTRMEWELLKEEQDRTAADGRDNRNTIDSTDGREGRKERDAGKAGADIENKKERLQADPPDRQERQKRNRRRKNNSRGMGSLLRYMQIIRVMIIVIALLGIGCAVVTKTALVRVMMIAVSGLFWIILYFFGQLEKKDPLGLREMDRREYVSDAYESGDYEAGDFESGDNKSGNNKSGNHEPADHEPGDNESYGNVPEEPSQPDPSQEHSSAYAAGIQEPSSAYTVRAQESVSAYSARAQERREELERLYRQKDQLKETDIRIRALELAMSRIRELSEEIYQEEGSGFMQEVSGILSELTQGLYTSVSLDERMQLRINTPEGLLYLKQVSYGTMQQVYFAYRMAAARALGGEELPLVMDEPFAMYDDERLAGALRWLRQNKRQVILFTCQEREQTILRAVSSSDSPGTD